MQACPSISLQLPDPSQMLEPLHDAVVVLVTVVQVPLAQLEQELELHAVLQQTPPTQLLFWHSRQPGWRQSLVRLQVSPFAFCGWQVPLAAQYWLTTQLASLLQAVALG